VLSPLRLRNPSEQFVQGAELVDEGRRGFGHGSRYLPPVP
jgi:hypothetical protein